MVKKAKTALGRAVEMLEVNKIYQGCCLEVLKTFPDECVDCVVTSPPYWGLRDYGVAGQLGLEKTPEEYVAKMVEVFREVKRVLKKEGTLWLNLGDSYNSQGTNMPRYFDGRENNPDEIVANNSKIINKNLKPKDLCGIPWRVALALQADGWWLRQDIIWAKPNPMPESVTDRCTKAHEYVFLMTKNQHYYFDAEAIKEKADYDGRKDTVMKGGGKYAESDFSPMNVQGVWVHSKGHERWPYKDEDGVPIRNRRSVWTIPTQSFSGAHFATFPEKLIEPMIKAGTSEKGCCAKCGRAWVRVVEKERYATRSGLSQKTDDLNYDTKRHCTDVKTIGWRPTCKCNAEIVPPVVCDIFMGSGTVALVAKKLGVNYVGIELNPKYIAMAEKRINGVEENLFKQTT